MELEKLTSEQLVAKAKEHLSGIDSHIRNKVKILCSQENIITLLQAGAGIVYLNTDGKTCYTHEVTYQNYGFIATSTSQIEY